MPYLPWNMRVPLGGMFNLVSWVCDVSAYVCVYLCMYIYTCTHTHPKSLFPPDARFYILPNGSYICKHTRKQVMSNITHYFIHTWDSSSRHTSAIGLKITSLAEKQTHKNKTKQKQNMSINIYIYLKLSRFITGVNVTVRVWFWVWVWHKVNYWFWS